MFCLKTPQTFKPQTFKLSNEQSTTYIGNQPTEKR
jgi:hypothetical protein